MEKQLTFTWLVQWQSRSTFNIVSSDGGPYRSKVNAEIAMANALKSLEDRDDVSLLYYAVDVHEVEPGTKTIEDVRGDSVPTFEIVESSVKKRRRLYS